MEESTSKHINDNKAGKFLLKFVYPGLILIGTALLLLSIPIYYKGVGLGIILFATSIYIIDYGFVSRSDAFLVFLNALN